MRRAATRPPRIRRRFSAGLLAALVLVAAAARADSPDVRKRKALERGEQHLKERKLNPAIIEFQNALQVDKNFLPALHGLGRAYARKYWFFDATRELGRAQKLAPDSPEIAADFGRALLELSAWDDAEAQAAKIIAREPQSPQGLYIRAGALLGRAKAEEALAVLEAVPETTALRRSPAMALRRFESHGPLTAVAVAVTTALHDPVGIVEDAVADGVGDSSRGSPCGRPGGRGRRR